MLLGNNQGLDKGKHKVDQMESKPRLSKHSVRQISVVGNQDVALNTITASSGVVTIPTIRMNPSLMKPTSGNESLKCGDQQQQPTSAFIVPTNQANYAYSNVRGVTACVGGNVPHESRTKSKDHTTKKYSSEVDTKMKNDQIPVVGPMDHRIYPWMKDGPTNIQHYKPRSNPVINNFPPRFVNQTAVQVFPRENYATYSVHHSRPISRNDSTAFAVARKALEQQNTLPKMAPINFPPLRAPQTIVNVRHPFVTEARTKHNEIGRPKSKPNVAGPPQTGRKDLEHGRQTFHGYNTSQIAGIPNVQSLRNVTAYPRPETFGQPTVASVLFPDTSQFPQSPPFGTPQIGQLNQYQTFDPSSFATTPVNVNPVIPQFPAESSIPYPQYDNTPQFVQTNHYPPADMASSQYQYQPAGVGQLQDSPMFIQSLQSPIAVTDQYAPPNYARPVRTEMIPRLTRPPRFNKSG